MRGQEAKAYRGRDEDQSNMNNRKAAVWGRTRGNIFVATSSRKHTGQRGFFLTELFLTVLFFPKRKAQYRTGKTSLQGTGFSLPWLTEATASATVSTQKNYASAQVSKVRGSWRLSTFFGLIKSCAHMRKPHPGFHLFLWGEAK